MRYKIYALEFNGTDKIYVGYTDSPKRRLMQHRNQTSNNQWIKLSLTVKSMTVLTTTDCIIEARNIEAELILGSCNYNLNAT